MQSLIFFGSDQYSAIVLTKLLDHYSQNPTQLHVVTDQPKPKGRNLTITPNPVEKLSILRNIKASYYQSFNHNLITKNTLGLCAAFDHLIPQELISKFEDNLYNLHPSLLPQYRNVSPVQYALALGDAETGITLFRITPSIDNGKIIAQAKTSIHSNDTTPTLTSRLFTLGAQLFLDAQARNFTPLNQSTQTNNAPENLIFTKRLSRDSGYIEWQLLFQLLSNKPLSQVTTNNQLLNLRINHNPSGLILHDLLRALSPWPGVWSQVLTKKGDLRISIESIQPQITIKIAGKPNAISLSNFLQYYL